MGQTFSDLPTLENWFDTHFQLLKPISHKLFDRFEVRPYGILGIGDSAPKQTSKVKPGTFINAVIVVPGALTECIAYNPSKAHGVTREAYAWLGIDGTKKGKCVPPKVQARFSLGKGEEAEGLAKYHQYGPGQHVIHTISSVPRDLEQSITDLTETYMAVFVEFATALGANVSDNRPSTSQHKRITPNTLRLPPISSGSLLQNKHLAPHMGRIFWNAVAIALERLPEVLQHSLQDTKIEVCIFKSSELQMYKQTLEVVEQGVQLEADYGRVNLHNGSYDWIRQHNGPQDRMERLACSAMTSKAISSRGYFLPGGRAVSLRHVDAMIKNTCIKRVKDKFNLGAPKKSTTLRFAQGTVMDLAMQLAKTGQMTAAVSAASAYHVGGGVLSGGRHALEEAWCISSTLLKSLQQAQFMQLESEGEDKFAIAGHDRLEALHRYLPEDGVVVSPLVELFRDSSEQGYAFLPESLVLCGVVSIAMYNKNPKVRDSPVDAPQDPIDYQEGVRQKLRAAVLGAVDVGAEVLVYPSVGCGVFGNDPTFVGKLLGEVLCEKALYGQIAEVVLVGSQRFAEAAHLAFYQKPMGGGDSDGVRASATKPETTSRETVRGQPQNSGCIMA